MAFDTRFRISSDPRMPDLAEFMTTQEAAALLDYNQESVRRMLRDNELEGIKWGREWLVSRKSVHDYLLRTAGMEKNDPRRGNQ